MGYSSSKNDLNKKSNKKKILETGDFAWKDKQGYYFLVGRKDNFLKVAGYRINSNEIKNFLSKRKIFSEIVEKKGKLLFSQRLIKNQNQIISLFFLSLN